jgi:phosphoglycolate phosphatase
MKEFFLRIGRSIKTWLQSLSFRTGVIVLLCCIPFYILSFAQMLLPISAAAKGILWTVLFGMAKTCQYGGLTILGVEGYKRLKDMSRRKKTTEALQKINDNSR